MQKILEDYQQNGYCVISGFLGRENTKELKSLSEIYLQNTSDQYSFGKIKRITNPQPDILKFFDYPIIQDFCSFFKTRVRQVFISHEFKQGEIARNGYAHFDRTHMLKFFYNLMDVEEGCGGLTVFPKSQFKGEALRKAAWKATSNYKDVKNRIDIDYPELSDLFERKTLLLPAGSLVIFNTDCFHLGGQTEKGKERMVVRGHCSL